MKIINLKGPSHENFIGAWNIEDNDLCRNLIEFFEFNKNLQSAGSTTGGIDTSVKKTTDITIDPVKLKDPKYIIFNKYFSKLNECFELYKNHYPYLKSMAPKVHIGHFNLQKYVEGDHFSKLHCERDSINSIHRLFAWMTYLNNVDDGGTTDFEYFKIKIKPEIGKTLIWPAEWTHAHLGSVLNSGTKYIITGWMHFIN